MNKRELKMWDFDGLITPFTSEILKKYKNRLSEDTLDALFAYFADLCTNCTYDDLFKETYEKMSGTPERMDLPMNEEELFTLMIELCAVHIYEFNFKMKEFLFLLFAMRYSPETQKNNIEFWKQLLNETQ